jgi:nucleoid DNA-binding protein
MTQKEILHHVAKRHGINIGQAEEIWALFIQKIGMEISNPDKKTDDLYDIEKFPVIHIDNFGKFVPNVKNINYANHCLKLKKDGHHPRDHKPPKSE